MAAEDEFTSGAASTAGLVTSAALAAHEADTTAVHGVADTSKVVLTNAANTLASPAAGSIPLVLKGATSQTASLTEWRDSLDGLLALVSKDGSVHAPLGALLGVVEAAAAGYAAGFSPRVAGEIALLVQGVASQTGDLVRVRSSALVSLLRVLADGGVVSAGDVKADTIGKGMVTRSPDGTPYRLKVANGGALSVATAAEIQDSFTRANETPLTTTDTGQAWTTFSGTGLSVISNQLGKVTSGNQGSVVTAASANVVAGYTASVPMTGSTEFFLLRVTDASNYIGIRALTGEVREVVAGVPTALAFASTPSGGERITVTLLGSAITVWFNGALDTTATTTILSGTKFGFQMSGTTPRVDDFYVATL